MQFIVGENSRSGNSSSYSWFLLIGQLCFVIGFVLIVFSLMPTEKERFLKLQKRYEEEEEEAKKSGN